MLLKTPIPGFSISSSGVLALADLSTIAQRTALTGTSSWWDVLVLAPGIHYQQSAETLGDLSNGSQAEVTNLGTGAVRRVTNTATIHYLKRIGAKNNTVTLDVGRGNQHGKDKRGPPFGPRAVIFQPSDPSSKLSALLYVLSPLLTITAISIMIAAEDWWGIAEIVALMLARGLNIWVIQNRTKDEPPVSDDPNIHENWWIIIDGDHYICVRGLKHDLEAITTGSWMRKKSNIDGYLEGTAKMIVYLVAVMSGNMSQTGDIVLIVLLLTSAGLLALSNAKSNTFNMNGRTASVTGTTQTDDPNAIVPNPDSDGQPSSISDFEKSEAAIVMSRTYPFEDEVNYV